MMRELAGFAQYFEDTSPWKEEYKKKIDRSPIANSVNVVIGTGGTGPTMPIGINLPNEQAIREQYGTKSVLLHNVVDAYNKSTGQELVKELAWDEREVQNEEKYGTLADDLHTAMHEVIGHGSGKASPKLGGKDPSVFLPGYYNTLEEARADLVALWHAWDPKLVDIGVAKDAAEARAIGETMYQQAVRTALAQLRRIGNSTQLEEDHLKNRQLIVHYALENSSAIAVEKREGKTYYRIADYDSLRGVFGRLLAEIMRIKAEGDLAAGKTLVDRYGLKVDVSLRDEIQGRVRHLNLPSYTAFVMPKLEPVSRDDEPDKGQVLPAGSKHPAGQITDVKVSYPLDLAAQMLEYSGFTKRIRKD
jgi:dipeptidyl-peptidase-3